jgi:hypothetical protein
MRKCLIISKAILQESYERCSQMVTKSLCLYLLPHSCLCQGELWYGRMPILEQMVS